MNTPLAFIAQRTTSIAAPADTTASVTDFLTINAAAIHAHRLALAVALVMALASNLLKHLA